MLCLSIDITIEHFAKVSITLICTCYSHLRVLWQKFPSQIGGIKTSRDFDDRAVFWQTINSAKVSGIWQEIEALTWPAKKARQLHYLHLLAWFFPSIGIEMKLKLKMLKANTNAKQVQVRPKETSFLSLEWTGIEPGTAVLAKKDLRSRKTSFALNELIHPTDSA